MNDKQDALREKTTPVMEWLRENMHPHAKIIITSSSAELVEGLVAVSDSQESTDE